MAKIDVKSTDNPKLSKKTLSDGRESLYLVYYLGYTKEYNNTQDKEVVKICRQKEFLNLYLISNPTTSIDRQTNKATLELAKEIRIEKEQEFKEGKTGKRLNLNKSTNFITFYQTYIDNYTKKDIRMIEGALKRFKDYLSEEYPLFVTHLQPNQINKEMIEGFVEFLESKSKGEGARGYYQRFKKVVSFAIERGIMQKNPCTGVTCKIDDQVLRKDVLSLEEMEALINTTYLGQSDVIKRGFVFSLYTGIRFCDLQELKFGDVDFSNRVLKFEQSKTKGKSVNSGVVIPLNDGLLELIGDRQTKETKIFPLPSSTMCLKALRRWTERAGIHKHITWHCARHSFAVNILNGGANIKTVASLLGHSGLKHTEKYTRAVDQLKTDAINSLPTFKLSK